jgi:hypothetical protein
MPVTARSPGQAREIGEVFREGRVQHLPALALARAHGGDRTVEHGVEQHRGEVGMWILRQHPDGAAGNVLGGHGSGIAAAAVQPIELATVGAHLDRVCRHLVVGVDPLEAIPPPVVSASCVFDPAVRRESHGKQHADR